MATDPDTLLAESACLGCNSNASMTDMLALALWDRISSGEDGCLVEDSFDRADNPLTLGNADVGGAWTVVNGTWGIVSLEAFGTAPPGGNFAFFNVGVSDCIVQLTVTTISAAAVPAVLFRFMDVGNFWILFQFSTDTYLRKFVAGAPTTLFGPIAGAADGDVLRVVLNGNLIQCFRNGIQIGGDVNDADGATQTRHGMFTDAADTARFDDFSICELE